MMHTEIVSSPQKKILLKCLVATLGLHLVAFFIFYKFPPSLPREWHRMFIESLPLLRMKAQEDENLLLEEFLDPFPDISTFTQPYDLILTNQDQERRPLQEQNLPLHSPLFIELSAPEETRLPFAQSQSFTLEHDEDLVLALPESLTRPVPSVDYSLSDPMASLSVNIENDVEEDEPIPPSIAYPQKVPTIAKKDSTILPQIKVEALPTETKQILTLEKAPPLPLDKELHITPPLQSSLTTSLPSIENYQLPKQKTVEIAGENLEAEVRLGKATGGKYLFTVSLKPAKNAVVKTLQQNYTFLIDRSNSIEKYHFTSFKKATLRALSMLQTEDTFNIIVFDKKAVYFRKEPVFFSKESLAEAESFLNEQKSGGLFAAADLYETLPRLLPKNVAEDEVNTIILLTDGTSDAKPKKQELAIKKLLETSKNKFVLYTAAVGKDNNLKLLELISGCAGGSLLYSDTYAAFPRRLAGLVHRLRAPIAKDVVTSILNPDTHCKLYTTPPSVFHSGQPYEIVGITDTLEDFTLLIEGMHEKEAIRIKKKISFANAKKDSAYVNQQRTLVDSRLKYEKQLALQ